MPFEDIVYKMDMGKVAEAWDDKGHINLTVKVWLNVF